MLTYRLVLVTPGDRVRPLWLETTDAARASSIRADLAAIYDNGSRSVQVLMTRTRSIPFARVVADDSPVYVQP